MNSKIFKKLLPKTNITEITYGDFIKNPECIDKLITKHPLAKGESFYTFPKLKVLIKVYKSYYDNLVNNYQFKIDEGDICVDIGAHHGIITMNLALLGVEVFSFEPNPINFYILSKN